MIVVEVRSCDYLMLLLFDDGTIDVAGFRTFIDSELYASSKRHSAISGKSKPRPLFNTSMTPCGSGLESPWFVLFLKAEIKLFMKLSHISLVPYEAVK